MSSETILVNISRLDGGDISASYSADRIAEGAPTREPFRHDGARWVSVCGYRGRGVSEYRAYRVVPAKFFIGTRASYSERTRHDDGETARADPMGFYHGVAVKHGGETLVLIGPEQAFRSDGLAKQLEPLQYSFFGEDV